MNGINSYILTINYRKLLSIKEFSMITQFIISVNCDRYSSFIPHHQKCLYPKHTYTVAKDVT